MEVVYDIAIVGFGPAALSLAVAFKESSQPLNIRIFERKPNFSWRGGESAAPGARMRTSLLQDLVTQRDPVSSFTFLNYLWSTGSLVDYTNLSLVNPPKSIFSHYLRWAASKLDESGWIQYDKEVHSITPVQPGDGEITTWSIASKDIKHGTITSVKAKQVVVAVGSQARLPALLINLKSHPSVFHAEQYQDVASQIQQRPREQFKVAILGADDEAVEIFEHLSSLNATLTTYLFPNQSTLRQTDNNPFLSSAVQNPGRLPYELQSRRCAHGDEKQAQQSVESSVVSRVYLSQYSQLVKQHDRTKHKSQILTTKMIVTAEPSSDGQHVVLGTKDIASGATETYGPFQYVIAASGYEPVQHARLMTDLKHILDNSEGKITVDSNYRINFRLGKVAAQSGVWVVDAFESESGDAFSFMALRSERLRRSLLAQTVSGAQNGKRAKTGAPSERAAL